MILPITTCSPGGEKDFRAEGRESPQVDVVHENRLFTVDFGSG